jgi:hypothetical protein
MSKSYPQRKQGGFFHRTSLHACQYKRLEKEEFL